MAPNDPVVYEPSLRKDANEVKLRLLKAGVNLDGYTWDLLNVFINPVGFDFRCADHQRLVQEAERSRHLALNFVEFNRVGVSFDLHTSKNYRVALSATCSIFGERDCTGTITVSGRW